MSYSLPIFRLNVKQFVTLFVIFFTANYKNRFIFTNIKVKHKINKII